MRIYRNFPEAQNEVKRDLAELGTSVHPETMQDRYVADNPEYETIELQNYIYTVLRPDYTEIEGIHEEWVKQEWQDRLVGDLNPGHAWKKRRDVWEQFIEKKGPKQAGRFSYSYSERMGGRYLQSIVDEIGVHPNSRQLYLPVWSQTTDYKRRGQKRVPCSLGYWFVVRNKQVHLTYMMRSCDIFTHYPNDIALAAIMLHYVAKQTGYSVGSFVHFVGSLHCYKKDVKDVF